MQYPLSYTLFSAISLSNNYLPAVQISIIVVLKVALEGSVKFGNAF